MSVLNEHSRQALTSGRLGYLTTLNSDGSAQVSAVWIGLDNDTIVIGHLMSGQKVSNIKRDPRVVLCVEASGANEVGMTHYLVINGTASVRDGGAAELLQRLAHRYLGENVKFPPMQDPPAGHVIAITPQRVGGVGPWGE